MKFPHSTIGMGNFYINIFVQSKKANPNSSVVAKQFGFACFGGQVGTQSPKRAVMFVLGS